MIKKLSLEVLGSQFSFQKRRFQNGHGKMPLIGMECISLPPPPHTSACVFFGTDEYWNRLTEDEPFSISPYKGCLSLLAIRNWERTILVTASPGNLEMSTKFKTLTSVEGLIFLHSFRIGVFVLMTIIISILIRLGKKTLWKLRMKNPLSPDAKGWCINLQLECELWVSETGCFSISMSVMDLKSIPVF